MTFPMKNSVLDDFPLCFPAHPPPPEKRKFYFYCRLAFSDWRSLVLLILLQGNFAGNVAGILQDLFRPTR